MAAQVPPSTTSKMIEKERTVQREYWEEHSKKQGSSMENMMLDKSAAKLDLLDRPEILSLLPPYAGTRVLELASGIGRFTGVIASTAARVVTVEFMEDFLAKNKELNNHFGNVEFICADVLALELPHASFDLSFSCWIQMYLNDDEVRSLAKRTLEWVKPGGHAFFRESCFRQSGDVSRAFNPSHYRHPNFYTTVFSQVRCEDSEGKVWGLELVLCRNLETYVEVKGNKGQICWLWRKVCVSDGGGGGGGATTPAAAAVSEAGPPSGSPPLPASALMNGNGHAHTHTHTQTETSTQNALLTGPAAGKVGMDEGVFGAGFGSDRVGGKKAAAVLAAALGVKEGERVVDWQCGLGGYGLYLAEQHKAKVWGVEERTAQIEVAIQHAMAHTHAHTVLEACVLSEREFEKGSVDAVLYADAPGVGVCVSVLPRFCGWVKEGGRVVVGMCVEKESEGEEAKVALEKAFGGKGEVTLTEHTQEMIEWVKEGLANKTHTQTQTQNPIEEVVGVNGNGGAGAAAGSKSENGGNVDQKEGGLDAEAEACWMTRLTQAQAGILRYYVLKGVKKTA